ncbi:uncharacterized protein LOC127855118 [Dreissena polymorpha]|uniref:uncharacterized protein LOC127855118 n=1 Tax=Dreissena polymorpha TaxID=45954 RepID=UPI002263BD8F|nr:uncharacterized protein LOC127855118 [Dreissena polymorpha]XP_052246458.1 uncharacterized protein LOC127855118 [Dreissena polymorpha]XP_052246459.1 uncharacterized protein LOC127855118 [Dreissena polymorpha]XP_052246460.1 uncharacterized protein LOC127855118 [Dreissena polymorpha]XP_052246461.1 uncharacterized protein LOC127855118 [Dreissena polymorpha]
MSSSEHWRRQGNDVYVSVEGGMAPSLQIQRFQKAIQCYQKAFDVAKTEADSSSAAKNIGRASWRCAKVHAASGAYLAQYRYTLLHLCKEALKNFSFAYTRGFNVMPHNWVTDILSSCRACWEDVAENMLNVLDIDLRCQALYDVTMAIEIKEIKGEAFYKLAECHFQRGILAIQNKDFKKCLCVLRDCYMPLNEAERLSHDTHTKSEVKVLEEDVQMHMSMAESMQARQIGDEMFEAVVRNEETLNIDMVWEVIDWYKQATLRTRDITEVELEAIAVSRIGRVYDRVLKLKQRAKDYYKLAVELAHAMSPRTFVREDWYIEATQVLAKYQSETVQAEETRQNIEKAEILKELTGEMKQLKELENKDNTEFLTFIYKTFPPKKENQCLVLPTSKDDDWRNKMKKSMQTAVIHYHPDSVDEKMHGKKWKVLCEEITKCCTRRYECMK